MHNKELFPTTGKFMLKTKLVSYKLCTTFYDVSKNVAKTIVSLFLVKFYGNFENDYISFLEN